MSHSFYYSGISFYSSCIFISPKDPGLGIIVAILWIPFVLLMAHKMNVGKLESKIRTRKLNATRNQTIRAGSAREVSKRHQGISKIKRRI